MTTNILKTILHILQPAPEGAITTSSASSDMHTTMHHNKGEPNAVATFCHHVGVQSWASRCATTNNPDFLPTAHAEQFRADGLLCMREFGSVCHLASRNVVQFSLVYLLISHGEVKGAMESGVIPSCDMLLACLFILNISQSNQVQSICSASIHDGESHIHSLHLPSLYPTTTTITANPTNSVWCHRLVLSPPLPLKNGHFPGTLPTLLPIYSNRPSQKKRHTIRPGHTEPGPDDIVDYRLTRFASSNDVYI